jgi:hypothetical protein
MITDFNKNSWNSGNPLTMLGKFKKKRFIKEKFNTLMEISARVAITMLFFIGKPRCLG